MKERIEVIETWWNDSDTIKLVGKTGELIDNNRDICTVLISGREYNLHRDELKILK